MNNLKIDFQEFLNNYSDMIYNIAINYLANKEDAEDIVQETFLKYIEIIKSKGEFDSEKHTRHWLIRVALNLCNNEINSAKHNRIVSFEDYKTITYKYNSNYYDDIIEKLEDKYRTVFRLFYIDDMKITDISKKLCISEANVKTRLRRARIKVKKIMKIGGEKEDE